MIAYIPARGGSKRIPRKNIKLLDGKPIIGYVIENIKKLDFISNVYVSTDDAEIQNIAKSYGAEAGTLRSLELSGDNIGFMQLIQKDVPRFIKGSDKEVLFVLATSALVPTSLFKEAAQYYMKKKPQLLMAATEYRFHVFKAMVQKEDGYWRYLFPEESLLMTQDLPETRVDAGLFYIFNLDYLANLNDFKSIERLDIYQIDQDYVGDPDTPELWRLLEEKYQKLHMNKKL